MALGSKTIFAIRAAVSEIKLILTLNAKLHCSIDWLLIRP